MQVTPLDLVDKIAQAYEQLPRDKRLLVAIAGPPGSGKSTLAYPLTDALNARLAPAPAPCTSAANDKGPAVCVGLDGWHFSRAELARFDDPVEAVWRRGAAFTFDLASYLSFLQLVRLPLSPLPSSTSASPSSPSSQPQTSPKAIPFPTFDHALKDPLLSPTPITPAHRIIIVEGLYTLLDQTGWKECTDMFNVRVWVEVDPAIARGRLARRNFEAGIAESLEKCQQRVDAVDMINGEHVRIHRVEPTYIIPSIDGQPFSAITFEPSTIVPAKLEGGR